MSRLNNCFSKFNTSSEYDTFKESSGYTKPNVSWIVNENDVKSEPYIKSITNGIVLQKNGAFKIVTPENFDAYYNNIIASGYTIEGISVVPSTHTSDGTYRIMSLKLMSYSYPDVGTIETEFSTSGNTMYWGGSYSDVPGLAKYQIVPKINNVSGETTISAITYGYLPSDAFTGTTKEWSVVDEKARYGSGSTESNLCPSPYMADDEPNPLYGISGTSSSNLNGLSDMDGSGNTEIIVANATGQADWRTASTITNTTGSGYYPAACCCKRYGTSGIPSGSWYLPSVGELGYAAVRLGTINSILSLIASKDQSICTANFPINNTWTSTYNGYDNIGNINFYSNFVAMSGQRSNNYYVRAFTKVNATQLKFN